MRMHHTQRDWELQKLRMKKASSSSRCRIVLYGVADFFKLFSPWWVMVVLQSSATNECLPLKQGRILTLLSPKRRKGDILPHLDIFLAQAKGFKANLGLRFRGCMGCQPAVCYGSGAAEWGVPIGPQDSTLPEDRCPHISNSIVFSP